MLAIRRWHAALAAACLVGLAATATQAQPTGACCVSWNCSITTQNDCQAMMGRYLGDGTSCGFVISNPNLPIPDNDPIGVSDVLTVFDSFPLLGVRIDVWITHTWIGDLSIAVEHNGLTVPLWYRVCGSYDDLDVVFDDAGAPVVCASPTVGDVAPQSCGGDLLALFDGMDAAGDWIIRVADHAGQDLGTLVRWSVHFGNPCRVVDSVICELQPPNHPPDYWYTVTPGQFGRCDFHVKVFDPNPANYVPGPMPANTWQFAVHQVGNEWWASWWDPNCQNAIFAPFTFTFTNANPSTWSDWTTTISATNDPHNQVIDEAANHNAEPDGFGYRVHVPVGEENWYWKDYNGDEPDGFMPDFDQNQDFDGDGTVDANYCGPVAVGNSLWWFHRKYPDWGVVPNTWTNIDLIQDLAQRMATNGQTPSPSGHVVPYTGTFVDDMQLGIDDYLQAQGLTGRFYEHTEPMPDFDFIATEVQRSQDVVLLVGFYHIEFVEQMSPDYWIVHWTRQGGHYLTVAGVDSATRRVALSDPDQDGAEQGASGVERPPGVDHNHDGDNNPATTMPFRNPGYNHAVHNDETFASHDFFTLKPSISPGGQLALVRDGDPLAYGGEVAGHHLGDAGGTYQAPPTPVNLQQLIENGYPIPEYCQTYAEIEYAVVVSPQPVDIVVCEPQPPFHPPTYWYDVTVGNSVGVMCDFHVEVFDPNPANYTNIVGPANWSFTVQQVGNQWWATWWTPGCNDPVWAPGQAMFGFDNPNASTWGHWRTTYSGDQDPDTPWIADRSENHAGEPDGYGYRVHAPLFQALPEACCLPDGTCLDLDYMVCVQQFGGWPQGPGTNCAIVRYCPDLKWAQPPTYFPQSPMPHCFWGWDEPSDWLYGPIVADDFACLAPKPITDIHWWGSYLAWFEPFPPPVGPPSFHLGIWTDVPAGAPGNPYPFSHPGVMIWEWWVPRADLQETYVGCDFTPWTEFADAAFRYDFQIPRDQWFWQAAGDNVYWLSIAAVNCHCNGDFNGDGLVNAADLAFFMNCVGQPPLGPCAQADLNCDGAVNNADMAIMACMVSTPNWWECCPYEQYWTWGWKTRRPHWNDDGVRMWMPVQPVPGAEFFEGVPIEDPMGESWDLAFVLTTGCPGDSNCDGVINWRDIDYFVAAMNNNIAAWRAMFAPNTPPCSFWNNDVNGDGVTNWRDIDPLVALMNTVCP